MKKQTHRPHLTVRGTLCDEDPPCVHSKTKKRASDVVVVIGTIVGTLAGVVAALLTIALVGKRLNGAWVVLIVFTSFGIGALFYNRLRR